MTSSNDEFVLVRKTDLPKNPSFRPRGVSGGGLVKSSVVGDTTSNSVSSTQPEISRGATADVPSELVERKKRSSATDSSGESSGFPSLTASPAVTPNLDKSTPPSVVQTISSAVSGAVAKVSAVVDEGKRFSTPKAFVASSFGPLFKPTPKVLKSLLTRLTGPQIRTLSAMMSLKGALGANHYKFRLVRIINVSTDITGSAYGVIDLDPSNWDEWSAFNTLFDEFRVMSVGFHWAPKDRYSKISTESRVFVCAFDNDDSNAPSGVTELWQYPNAKLFNCDDPAHHAFKRPDVTASAYWADVGSPSNSLGSIKYYMAGNTVSTVYGSFYCEMEVEMRGRR